MHIEAVNRKRSRFSSILLSRPSHCAASTPARSRSAVYAASFLRFESNPGHPVKVHEQRQEYFVGRWAVLQDSQKVRLDRDGWDVTCVETQRRGR